MSEPAATTQDTAGVERTPTGEIATQTQTKDPAATTPQTTTTTEGKPSLANEPGESLTNQKPTDQVGAPTEYATFAVPDGYELDTAVATEAGKIFKEMNLTQDQAQKLVDFYTAKTTESANQPYDAWNQMQEKWVKEVKADPQMGPRLNEIKTTISRAIDGLGDPKLAADFRAAMDYTGAGNNPSFIKAFWKLASKVTEGGHVSGNGPNTGAQPNSGRPASAAQAMYPNLPFNR